MAVPVRLGSALVLCEISQDHAVGLQRHASLGEGEGLLFQFPTSRVVTFHQGSVPFPIDVVFVDQGHVAHVACGRPGDRARWTHRASSVVEVPGGFCARHAVVEGAPVSVFDEANPDLHWQDRDTAFDCVEDSAYLEDPSSDFLQREEAPIDFDQEGIETRRSAQIQDQEAFVQQLAAILLEHAHELRWEPDRLNGMVTEHTKVDADTIHGWLEGRIDPMYFGGVHGDAGLELIGDAAVLAGVAEQARIGNEGGAKALALFRTRR